MKEDFEQSASESQDEEETSICVDQFGALCIRHTPAGSPEVPLISTRETKRWTIPKFWPIKGRKPYQVAEQEAWEEAGKRAVGAYDYIKRLADGGEVLATVDVNVQEVKLFPEREERRLMWLSHEKAAHLVTEPRPQKLLRGLSASRAT